MTNLDERVNAIHAADGLRDDADMLIGRADALIQNIEQQIRDLDAIHTLEVDTLQRKLAIAKDVLVRLVEPREGAPLSAAAKIFYPPNRSPLKRAVTTDEE